MEKFKLIKVLDQKTDTVNGIVRLVELHEYKGKVFKFRFENSNGRPCGFDYKHSASVFNQQQDEWKYLGDKNDILAFASREIDCVNYYGNGASLRRGAKAFMEACQEYVKILYKNELY